MTLKAANSFILIIRDVTATEKAGILIPGNARQKPHEGLVYSVGANVKDQNLKQSKGKKVMFHQTAGFPIEFEGQEYLVLSDEHIIGIIQK